MREANQTGASYGTSRHGNLQTSIACACFGTADGLPAAVLNQDCLDGVIERISDFVMEDVEWKPVKT